MFRFFTSFPVFFSLYSGYIKQMAAGIKLKTNQELRREIPSKKIPSKKRRIMSCYLLMAFEKYSVH